MSEECPEWCGGGHRCTAPQGEHRSHPQRFPAPYGSLIATRVRTAAGREHLELRAVIRLPQDAGVARMVAAHLAVGVDLTIRAILAGRLSRVRAAYHRITGVRVRG